MPDSDRKLAQRTLTDLVRPLAGATIAGAMRSGTKWLQPSGSFELVRRLGTGGMAEVWMARRQTYGAQKVVAIKLIAPHLCDSPAHRRMFETEAELSMMLSHSNIVQVFDLCRIDGRSGLVMEWVDGVNLAQLLIHGLADRQQARRPLSFVTAAFIVGELLKALAYAHGGVGRGGKRAIIHRDISPHNVLVSTSGEVKLADFGIARLSSEDTSGGHIRGKLRYMAPEQASGETRSPQVDLYAVGAVFHELLDGRAFRADVDREDLFRSVVSGEFPALRRADVPAPLVELHDLLLHANPADRLQSAAAALAKLRTWAGYRNASVALAELVRDAVHNECSDVVSTRRPASQSSYPVSSELQRRGARAWTLLKRPIVRLSAATLLSASLGFALARSGQSDPEQFVQVSAIATTLPSQGAGERALAPTVALVTFSTVDLQALEIKVGNRQILLNPRTEVEFAVGVHELQLQDPNGRWRPLGELEFEGGERYNIEFARVVQAP